MMDQFVLDLTREWKALGLPLNPRLGGCQPASCAYCRCDLSFGISYPNLSKQIAGSQQSLQGWQLGSAPLLKQAESALLTKSPRPQPSKPPPSFAGISSLTKIIICLVFWLDFLLRPH